MKSRRRRCRRGQVTEARAERILFLPGASGDSQFWKPLADRLDHPAEKIVLGWPGFGRNPRDPNVNSLSDLYRSVHTLIDRPVDLVAQSMGGVLAMRAALEAPALVRHLVLTATSGGLDVKRLGAIEWRDERRRAEPTEPSWFTDDRSDYSDRFGEIAIPVLLIWGDADPISPVAVGRHLAEVLPRAELMIVRGGDHSLGRDRADEIAPLIDHHLLA